MKLPCFEDFLSSVSPDTIEQIMSDAKMKCEDSAEFGTGSQICAVSWTISLELLALYHQWLENSL